MRFTRLLAVLAVSLLASVGVFAQSALTGALTGTVTSDGVPLPGATVTVTSPQLQGTRTAISDANGNYNIASLPPGDYNVRVELEGLQAVARTTRVTLAGTARVDADLTVSAVTETITVTANAPAVMETTEVQTNYQKETIDNLPIQRNVNAIALLSPGVTANGPSNALQISGSFSNDNLIVVNGANIQENLRGQARPLFIEDAIQETTAITGAVSAEYGRFTGGVISSITKSGGNEFSGSLRDNLTNPAWTADTAFPGDDQADSTLNHTWEATLGGRIIRDRLWFFTAGRLNNITTSAGNVLLSNENIESETENQRIELKLTGQVAANHSLMFNYLENPLSATNDNQRGVYGLRALDPSIEQEEDFLAGRYSGIFTNNLLGEVNFSKRTFTFVGFGGEDTNIYTGTPLLQLTGGTGVANAPWFCGSCDQEGRDNELLTAKLTYFLGSGFGTHNIVGGFEDFNETRIANNYQSPTNIAVGPYQVPASLDASGRPIFTFTEFDFIYYAPVAIPSIGSDLTTQSLFINDKWDLNSNWSFNLGLRYDATEAQDSQGNPTADDSQFSPRLGATYDVGGNGRFKVNGSYSKYVGRLAESVQNVGSSAGETWNIYYYYDGPAITGTADQVVRQAVDWWLANGGEDFANWEGAYAPLLNIGGVSTRLEGGLKAPGLDEFTFGAGFQLSPNAYIRADYINRDWNDFYVQRTNVGTGTVIEPITGAESDLTLVSNTDDLDRKYEAIQLAANARFFERLNTGANYTLSELTGNTEGETTSGPGATGGYTFQYAEYQGFAQNFPSGYLSGDQRHKLRAWAAMDFPLGPAGVLNVSLLERFDSGRPYSLSYTTPARDANGSGPVRDDDGFDQYGYLQSPQTVTYFIGERGSQRWEDVTATDLALNYRLPIGPVQFFAEGEVVNVFDEQAQIGGTTTLQRIPNSPAINPFTEAPVEGTHYRKATTFGQTRSGLDYQTPRTYRLSVGLRF